MSFEWIGRAGGVGVRLLSVEDLPALRRWFQPGQDWHRWDGAYFPKMTSPEADAWIERLRAGLQDGDSVVMGVLREDMDGPGAASMTREVAATAGSHALDARFRPPEHRAGGHRTPRRDGRYQLTGSALPSS